jgi:hypothetical protein
VKVLKDRFPQAVTRHSEAARIVEADLQVRLKAKKDARKF